MLAHVQSLIFKGSSMRMHRKSIATRKMLKRRIVSGKILLDLACCIEAGQHAAIGLASTSEYKFVLLMHEFHRRHTDLLRVAENIRKFRKSCSCRPYMRVQLRYAELMCLIDHACQRLEKVDGLQNKLKNLRRRLPKKVHRTLKRSKDHSSVLPSLRLVS